MRPLLKNEQGHMLEVFEMLAKAMDNLNDERPENFEISKLPRFEQSIQKLDGKVDTGIKQAMLGQLPVQGFRSKLVGWFKEHKEAYNAWVLQTEREQ